VVAENVAGRPQSGPDLYGPGQPSLGGEGVRDAAVGAGGQGVESSRSARSTYGLTICLRQFMAKSVLSSGRAF
jgi:hypothetical protein